VLACRAVDASAFYLFVLITSNPFPAHSPIRRSRRDLNPVLQDIGLAYIPPYALSRSIRVLSISFSVRWSAALIEWPERAGVGGALGAAWSAWWRGYSSTSDRDGPT